MRSRSHLTATIVGFLTILVACNGGPSSQAPCPEGSGEFPPTACAYVEGRLTAAGAPITGAGLRVDVFVPPMGYAYSSNAASTGAMGRFGLIVFRQNQFQPPTTPDTASVYIKLYESAAAARPGAATDDSLAVLMTFAPMGTIVDTTYVELTLP